MALTTAQHMTRGAHHLGTSTGWAVARCAPIAYAIRADADTVQGLLQPWCLDQDESDSPS